LDNNGESKKSSRKQFPSEVFKRSKRSKLFKSGGIRRVGEPRKRMLHEQRTSGLVLPEVARVAVRGGKAGEVEEGGEEETLGRAVAVEGARRRLRLRV